MYTTNKYISITIDPKNETNTCVTFPANDQPQFQIQIGGKDAYCQFDDMLNKFSSFDTETQIQIWKRITKFIDVHGYKIVEAGGVVPQ